MRKGSLVVVLLLIAEMMFSPSLWAKGEKIKIGHQQSSPASSM